MKIVLGGICLDCRDAEELAGFYSELLGWPEVYRDGPEWIALRQGDFGISFQAEEWYEPPVWPEQPDELTKMMHFEIATDDVPAAVERATLLGAREAAPQPSGRDPNQLRVMLDPAGHPFCLCNDDA